MNKRSESKRGANHPMYGKHHSAETKAKMRESHRIVNLSSGVRKRRSESKKGINNPNYGKHWHCSKQHKLNIGMSNKIAYSTSEIRIRQSNWAKQLWQNSNFATKMMLALQIKPNKLELWFQSILDEKFPREWMFVGDGQLIIGGKCPDFWDGSHKLIELYGDYWHRGQNPQDRIDHFHKFGFDCLVIWEHEVKSNIGLEQRIRNWIMMGEGRSET